MTVRCNRCGFPIYRYIAHYCPPGTIHIDNSYICRVCGELVYTWQVHSFCSKPKERKNANPVQD